ncbi:UNVERIFIED_CONTAM: hypothetical protein K2H54_035689 [Gekko kuhli]
MHTTFSTLELLKQNQRNPTSYNCNSRKQIFAALGALASENSIQMANMLTNYKIPQMEGNVTLVHGEIRIMDELRVMLIKYEYYFWSPIERVWVITAKWDFTTMMGKEPLAIQSLSGTLSFALHTNVVSGFDEFLDTIDLRWHPDIIRFWEAAFKCYFLTVPQPYPGLQICTGQEKLSSLPGTMFETRMSGESYSIFNAAYAVAHALHALHASTGKWTARGHGGKRKLGNIQPWQVSLSSSFTHC